MKEAMVEPAPGKTPMRNPITEPLTKAKRQSRRSCAVGSRLRRPLGTGNACGSSRASMLARTSPRAKTPIATTTKSIPDSSSMRPKVKREVVLKGSVPMPASHRPTSMARSAFTSERRRDEHESEHADRAGDERSNGGDAKRGAGAAFARELIAVQARDYRRG